MDKKYRIVIVGCGDVSPTWIEYLLRREDCEIIALADVRIEAAEEKKNRFSLNCPVYSDGVQAIEECKPNLVCDLTVPASHCDITTAALKRDIDVIAEKPMSNNLESAEYMVKTAVESGKNYSLLHQRRFLNGIRDIRDFLDTGAVGKPGFICCDFFLGPHYFGGFKELMDSPLLIDMSVHTLDMARYILNAEPVSVYCHEFNPAGSWFRDKSSAIAIYEMSDGSVFCYRGSWSAEGHHTTWEADWRIQCEKGTIRWDGAAEPTCEVPVETETPKFLNTFRRIPIPRNYQGAEGYDGCLNEMFAALEEGRPALTDCRDNIHSIRMLFGAVKSAREGRKIYIKDLL